MVRKPAQRGRQDQDDATPQGNLMFSTLSAVASEIEDLATLSDRLQLFISAALVADGGVNSEHLREFQALDLLVQRLHGMAAFVSALAQSAPKNWRIDARAAASNVTLADLARRLGGHKPGGTSFDPSETSASGDLELFG